MKYLKKVTTDAEIVAQDYSVVYYSEESKSVAVYKEKKPNVIYTYLDGHVYKDYTTTMITIEFQEKIINEYQGESYLTSVELRNISEMDERCFASLDYLTSVTISDSPITYIPDWGFYFSPLRNFVIPQNVRFIGRSAFQECDVLTSVTMGNHVETLGNQCFSNCIHLESISLPNTLYLIGGGAFDGCERLGLIKYDGSIAQWNAIEKDIYWHNGVPSTCIVHCTDGDINIADA